MNRYIYSAIGGGIFGEGYHHLWWLGAAIGIALAALFTPAVPTKRVIVEDITTGKIEIQPQDAATRRYLQGRGNK